MLSYGFCRSGGSLSKNERKRKDRQILGPCQRTKKIVEHDYDDDDDDGDTNCNWCTWNGLKKLKRKTRGISVENRKIKKN